MARVDVNGWKLYPAVLTCSISLSLGILHTLLCAGATSFSACILCVLGPLHVNAFQSSTYSANTSQVPVGCQALCWP